MKKLLISASAALVMTAQLTAQPTDKKPESVEIQIEGNKVTIEAEDMAELSQVDLNNIIREVSKRSQRVMQQHRQLMAQVDRQRENGEITEEQAEDMREMIDEHTEQSMEVIGTLMETWGEQYEARMENWEEQYEEQMEAWEAEVEARAESGNFVMPPLPPIPAVPAPMAPMPGDTSKKETRKIIIGEEGIIIRSGEDGEKPFALRFEERNRSKDQDPEKEKEEKEAHIDRTESFLDVHLGFNQMLRNGEEFITSGDEELNFWKSTAFRLGMGGKTRLGAPTSKLYFKYGGEFSWNVFRLTGDNILQKTADLERVVIAPDTSKNISLSKYRTLYFNVPLMFQLDFSDAGDMDESFTLGLGGYAGVRINTKRELEYSNDLYDDAEEEIKGDFFTNQFRYGVMGQVGWGNFKITARYDLNPYFQTDKGPDYQVASIAFGFTLI